MKIFRLAGLACLLTCGAVQAQDVKVNILTEFWYTQMMDNTLRNNAPIKAGASAYYDGTSAGRFTENAFNLKRAEIYCNYKISDEWAGYLMFDPNQATNTVTNNILQDFVITWTPSGTGFTVKGGQFKMPSTYESTLCSARDIIFFDRAQMSRLLGERRDRGLWAAYSYGSPEGFKGNLNASISNGTTDDGTSGKNAVDANAQKDYLVRFDGSYTKAHKFGLWYRSGQTNLKSSTTVAATLPASWTAAGVTAQTLLDNRDKTTATGLFYAFDAPQWHFDVEYATGLLGRRYPTLFANTAAAPLREHLDQKFQGYVVTGVYKMGAHQIAARYDVFNYNSGDDFYGAVSPYATAAGDAAPKYTETTVGYNYLFNPSKYTYGKLKVDYIIRSKNFLAANPGTTGLNGGNSLVASVMVGF